MTRRKSEDLTWWNTYLKYVRRVVLPNDGAPVKDISYWRNEIFFDILSYLTPLSIIALVPGLYMSITAGLAIVGYVDLLAFLLLITILLNRSVSLRVRKFIFILILYFLSIVLIYFVGLVGPGLLFLLMLTVLSSIIYSSSAGYYLAWANTFICISFGVLNYYKAAVPGVIDYSLGTWIAVTSNLILLSFACAKCLDVLLGGLNNSLHDNKTVGEKLKKASRLYQFISQINQGIVHIKDEKTLFHNVCQIAFETGEFQVAWIGKFDKAGGKIILVDQKGIPEEDIHLFDAVCEHNAPQDYVLLTGSYYICNDIESDLQLKNWKPFRNVHGIRSCIVLPIKKSGVTIGSFNLFAAVPDFFDEEEIILLEGATGDVSFALDVFEKEKKHKESEELVEKNNERFRALVENGTDAVVILSTTGKMLYASPSVERVLGYTEVEAGQLDLFSRFHPYDFTSVKKVWEHILICPGLPVAVNAGRLTHKDGTWQWLEGTMTNLLQNPAVNGIVYNFRDVTGKKLLEQQQAFDRNNLNALINNTNDLMWSVDRDFKLITCNKPFYELIKYLSKQSIGKGDDILAIADSPKQWNLHKTYYERAFAGESFTIVEHFTSPAEFWSEVSYYPIRNGEEVVGTACSSRDITKRKKSEENLLQSEKRLKESQEIAHLGNWELNFQTNEILASDEALRIYGLSLVGGKITLKTWISFIHPEDLDYVMAVNDEAGRTFSSVNFNHRIILRDGTIKYIRAESKFEFDQTGKPVGLYGIVQDVTERKIAEENLKKSELGLKEAQAIAQVGSWEIEIAHNVHYWSDEIYKIFGISKGDLDPSESSFLSFCHPDDLKYVHDKVEEGFKTFKNISFDFRFIRKGGEVRYCYNEWKFKFDKNNNAEWLLGIFQDITDRKLAESERTKMVNDLMQRNKDLEQFTYIVSHNLRAPVANILCAITLLGHPELDKEKKDILERGLKESVRKLDSVVKDLNQILQVKKEINETKEKVPFSKLVDDIKMSIQNLINKNNIEINYDFSDVGEMVTLKSYIYSIFYNLITNSIKYRQPNITGVINIKSRLVNDKIELVFIDNGMGIDLQKRGDQVFGLYKRFHTHIEGSGIGLFMTKTQVETLGGKISLTSMVNKGTEFKIEFNL